MNVKKEAAEREWERVKELQEMDRTLQLLQAHFNLAEMSRCGNIELPRDWERFTFRVLSLSR